MTSSIMPPMADGSPARHSDPPEIAVLLERLQSKIHSIPSTVLGLSTAPVREAFQRYYDLMALQYGPLASPVEDTPDSPPQQDGDDQSEEERLA